MKKITQEKREKGITLIALVVTIVVLLILAGVSINLIIGQDGLISKAKEAKNSSKQGEVTDRITAMLGEWQVEKHTRAQTIVDFLNIKKTLGELEDILDNGDETYTIVSNGYEATIDSNGELAGDIEKTGPRPQISDIKVVKNSDGTGNSIVAKSIYEGTPLYITFQTSIEGGEISSITKDKTNVTLPYAVTKNGTYTFIVIGNVDGKERRISVPIIVDQFKPFLRVGDYVNYPVSYENVTSNYVRCLELL